MCFRNIKIITVTEEKISKLSIEKCKCVCIT